jgi:hypothetical protein
MQLDDAIGLPLNPALPRDPAVRQVASICEREQGLRVALDSPIARVGEILPASG